MASDISQKTGAPEKKAKNAVKGLMLSFFKAHLSTRVHLAFQSVVVFYTDMNITCDLLRVDFCAHLYKLS